MSIRRASFVVIAAILGIAAVLVIDHAAGAKSAEGHRARCGAKQSKSAKYAKPSRNCTKHKTSARGQATAPGSPTTPTPTTTTSASEPIPSASYAPAPATAAFGLDLLGKLRSGNEVFSPDSIATALAMAGSGANGTSATQIASVLRLSSPGEFAGVGELQGAITAAQAAAANGDPEAPTLDLANALFLQSGFPLEPAFTAGLEASFGAGAPQTVDFQGDAPAAVKVINEWVDGHTQGMIPRILESVSPETRLALVDAIYLHAAWLDPFKASETTPASFMGEGGPVSASFMHETDELPYDDGDGYAAVELPYRASSLSLLILLPVGQQLDSLEGQLTPTELARIIAGLAPTPVALSLPRFHLAVQTELKGPLEALGMTQAFSEAANFSGITQSVDLDIGFVRHAAAFNVEEKGTEAAAATVVGIAEATAGEGPRPNPVVFNADHPFLFFLRDDKSGAVLFCGRLANPAAEAG